MLGLGVHARRCVVEDQDARIRQKRARNRQALLLPAGQGDAALAHVRIVAIRQTQDELVRLRRARRLFDLRWSGGGTAERNVLADRAREQNRILKHDADLRAQRGELKRAHVRAVNRHAPGSWIVKARHETDQRGFAGAGCAEQRNNFAGIGDK